MRRMIMLLMGLFIIISSTVSLELNNENINNLKGGRDLIGSSGHFNFYAPESHANYWDTIKVPIEDMFTTLRGLLDYPGGIDSIFYASTSYDINLYSSHSELDAVYSGSLPDWKCGFYNKSSGTLNLCIPETTIQVGFYSDFTTLAFNIFSQLAFELNINRRGGNNYPDYFKEGVGLYYSGFKPDAETVDNQNQVYYNEATLDPVDDGEDIWLEFACITYTVTNSLS